MISRLLPSLRARVMLGTVLVVCATALGVGGAITLSARSWAYEDAQNAALAVFTEEMEQTRIDGPSPPDVAVVRDGVVTFDRNDVLSQIPDSVRSSVESSPGVYRFERLPSERVAMGYSRSHGDDRVSYFAVRPLEGVGEKLDRLRTILVASVAGAVVLGIAFGAFVVRTVVRPLRTVESTAKQIAAGDASVRMPSTGVRELHDVTASLNEMLDQKDAVTAVLRDEEQRSTRFVADVSHELRSPLAALVPAAEVLHEELSDDTGVRGRAARLMSEEITALSALVEDLLEMTRRDAGLSDVLAEPVDVHALITDAVRRRGWHDVPVTGSVGGEFSTDPRRLTAIVTNLVGNAVRHGAPPVTVDLERHGTTLTVTVSDHGDGVSVDHLPRVFERLYKASDARTRTGGAGLGLAIARENARLLGGDVDYRRESGVTSFVVRVERAL
ncbi:HAMP domain-containing histidine kinase [Gordonia sp. HY285]|uniref:sensor histidine kinase n=1 Tax=Gordonia liuliyuniae TaxID=2911517 RepID=UPI001F3A1C6A|nr:HAMP domain-containing sensor histidine kinase [Gordonia liuliyuniae]MCF8611083.1 HAMP domain-containing histidine kinase [Gordonia liuliyuniae]